ncbi:MAG: orotate phosphoribosyltransferase [Chitinophagales bacterium]
MIYNDDIASKVAEYLLEIQAIKLSPNEMFTWASGKQSPIYCDNRLSLSFPKVRNLIKTSFAKLVKEKYPEADLVVGVATAGIAHGALLADALDLPFAYIRSKAKGHGMQNLIEGQIKAGAKVIVVEDLISTGGSSLKAVDAVREANAEVLSMFAIFTYGFQNAEDNFKNANCSFYTLSDFDHLLKFAVENKLFPKQELDFMAEWKAGA